MRHLLWLPLALGLAYELARTVEAPLLEARRMMRCVVERRQCEPARQWAYLP